MRKITGSYLTYSIPGKTATLVPEFAVEDLPSAELNIGSCVCSEGSALRQNILMTMIVMLPVHVSTTWDHLQTEIYIKVDQ